jgi:hypothetical protein
VIGAAAVVVAVISGADPALADQGRAGKAPTATAPASVGTQFHGLWSLYTDAQRTSVLNQLQAAGVHSVRMDVAWSMLQPHGRDSYDAWGVAFIDHVVNMAYQRGIRPLMTLWLTPPWANHGRPPRVLPDDPADYARVARWAAARWTNKVVGWEVWNEENSPAFLEGADPVAYVRLLRAAYPAFKAGYAGTTVVFGGLEYNDVGWIRRAYDAGAQGYFDVMSTHPYMGIADAPPGTPDDGTPWTLTHVQVVHDVMTSHGDGGKKIWFTEFGWSTHATDSSTPNWNRGVSEGTQAAYLAQTVALVRGRFPYVTRLYWYNDRDLADGGIQQRNYGLFRQDLSVKPAMVTLGSVNHSSSRPATAVGRPAARLVAGARTRPPGVRSSGVRPSGARPAEARPARGRLPLLGRVTALPGPAPYDYPRHGIVPRIFAI